MRARSRDHDRKRIIITMVVLSASGFWGVLCTLGLGTLVRKWQTRNIKDTRWSDGKVSDGFGGF